MCSESHLDGLLGWVSVPQQFVSCGLDTVHFLLPELQLSHQTLLHRNDNQSYQYHRHNKK